MPVESCPRLEVIFYNLTHNRSDMANLDATRKALRRGALLFGAKGTRSRAIFVLSSILAADVVAFAVAGAADSAWVDGSSSKGPSLSLATLPAQPERSRILARDGTEIAVLFNGENRNIIGLEDVSDVMVGAVLAVEDTRFFSHPGIDLRGIARAANANFEAGAIREGGSTLTQQYVRNVYLERERSVSRKLKEVGFAISLESQHSKKEILEAYLNTAYFGQGAYGVEAAAETFFETEADKLTVEQSALLVSQLPSPVRYSPFIDPDGAKIRRDRVLKKMHREHVITASQLEAALARPLGVIDRKTDLVRMAPHFVELIKKELLKDRRLGKTQLERFQRIFSGGITIHTSLDPKLQKVAQDAGSRLPRGVPESAIVVMDPFTGDLLAYRGGSDFSAEQYDLVTQGRRQPGSAFKTFGLVAALEQGYSEKLKLPGSSRCSFKLSKTETWKVTNYGGSGFGSLSLRDATAKSVNCAYANLVTRFIKPADVVATAKKMGIGSRLDPYESIVLGGLTVGVSPLEMTRAYGALAADGKRVAPRPIIEVRDREGNLILANPVSSERVLPANTARMATDILTSVVKKGTGTRASFGWDAAGKTGTTQSNRDAWFIGFTPRFVGGIWVGHPKGQVEMRNVTGGGVCAGIWREVMVAAHRGLTESSFKAPDANEFTRTKPVTETKKRRRRPPPSPAEAPAPLPPDEPSAPPPAEPPVLPPVGTP